MVGRLRSMVIMIILKLKLNYDSHRDNYRQVYKDLAFCENPLEREHEVEDVKVEKIRSLQEVKL